jgi:8-amino-7-oxononanoate synthase
MAVDLGWMDDERAGWEASGMARRLRSRLPAATPWVRIGGRRLVSFASNDYLALAADPRVCEAACETVRRYGWGAGAAPLVTGWTEEHEALASALADFEGVEAVTVFPSGFATNLGAVGALASRGDVVLLDRLAHGSLVAGARMSGARVRVFPHNDPERLDAILARESSLARRMLVVTESVFSMDGDVAPLAEIAQVAERNGAMLLVDEAHATGVIGEGGRGLAHEFGLGNRVTLRTGTLSKALGSIGGFVAGERRVVERAWHVAGSFRYSTSLPPAAAAAARAALGVLLAEPERLDRLRAGCRQLADGLRRMGVAPRSPSDAAIVPIIVGAAETAMSLHDELGERGFLVPAIRPPTIPRGTSRLRVSLTAGHDDRQISGLLEALAECGRMILGRLADGLE